MTKLAFLCHRGLGTCERCDLETIVTWSDYDGCGANLCDVCRRLSGLYETTCECHPAELP